MSKDLTSLRFGWMLLLLLSAPFLRFNSCMASQADSALALQLETTMHQRMAGDGADAIYQDADSGFKDNVDPARHRAWMGTIERKLGSPMACEQGETKVKVLFTRKIWSQCTTSFSKNSSAVETFVWAKDDDQYRLYYYDIKSDGLGNR